MSNTPPKTLNEFSRLAAEQFLQTAVFVDDNIYNRQTGSVGEPKLLKKPAPERKTALKSAETSASAKSATIDNPPPDDYSPQEIVISFAKKRILCSLYQPKRDASVGQSSDAYQLCLASDIVIIDWDLYGDAGQKALELLANLVKQSLDDVPEQLRLVLIYTKETNLESVASEVYDKLDAVLPSGVDPQQEDSGLALHTRNTRAVILGKPGRQRTAKYSAYEVTEKDIAERAVLEFTKLASGMLQSAVLLGLAKIRENSRKILTKFDSSLDPAFLTHRGLLLPKEEAADHVLPLLVAEIQSVLEDELPNPVIGNVVIEDWCATAWKPAMHAKNALSSGDAQKAAKDFCVKGATAVKSLGLNNKKLYSFLLEAPTSKSNHRLAMLMSQRTHYGKVARTLKLGTILKDSRGKFFLCLQPVCDSVRITGSRKFLMAELNSVAGSPFNAVIEYENTFFELNYKPKVFSSLLIEFKSAGTDSPIIASKEADGSFVFTAKGRRKYHWVAQLKPEHAQRVAGEFAHEISRVGLTESEWLRLLGKNS